MRDDASGGWKFHEIEDETNVNKRRAEVGLGPLENMPSGWGVAETEIATLDYGQWTVDFVPESNLKLSTWNFPTSKLEPFKNRLTKNFRHLGKWARRQGISCFRVYDNDIPGTPLAVDVTRHIAHIAEYERDHGMDLINTRPGWLNVSSRFGSAWYSPGCYFEIPAAAKRSPAIRAIFPCWRGIHCTRKWFEFSHPASGLSRRWLVSRPSRNTRQMVRNEAVGKRVLNLFAYTGSFTVYAAAGGAAHATVDMSNTYLQWADRNLALNGFSTGPHRLLQADVTSWLREPVREQFDLIVLDPPTFSNSKRMNGTLDTQRDHVWMLNSALQLCAPGGTIWFSTNYRRFKLEEASIRASEIRDISKQTVPEDFRNERIHQCFKIMK